MSSRERIIIAFALLAGLALAGAAIGFYFIRSSTSETTATQPPDPPATARSSQVPVFAALAAPQPVPVLRFIDEQGRELTLEAFRGKVVLLNLWATWCTPCRKEMPALDRVQTKLGGPRFEVVALSIDRGGVVAVKALYEELDLQALAIYVDPSAKAGDQLAAPGIPTTLLIDPEGREIGRAVGPAQWDSADNLRHLEQHIGRLAGAR